MSKIFLHLSHLHNLCKNTEKLILLNSPTIQLRSHTIIKITFPYSINTTSISTLPLIFLAWFWWWTVICSAFIRARNTIWIPITNLVRKAIGLENMSEINLIVRISYPFLWNTNRARPSLIFWTEEFGSVITLPIRA